MSVVEGVSFAQTGTRATSLTTCVTTEMSSSSFPMFEPMSGRSMWGQERFSSSASAPSSWQAFASICQWRISSSEPEPAMIEAIRTFFGCAFLRRARRPIHQSSGLSEMSSQFQDEWSAAPVFFFIEISPDAGSVRMKFVLGPLTLTTGWTPIVLVTTPAHPASNARRMFDSDSVGGAEESRNGFSNRIPVKVTERSDIGTSRPLAASSPRRPRTTPAESPALRRLRMHPPSAAARCGMRCPRGRPSR